MSERSEVERKLSAVRARDGQLKAAGEKMARGLSKAAARRASPPAPRGSRRASG